MRKNTCQWWGRRTSFKHSKSCAQERVAICHKQSGRGRKEQIFFFKWSKGRQQTASSTNVKENYRRKKRMVTDTLEFKSIGIMESWKSQSSLSSITKGWFRVTWWIANTKFYKTRKVLSLILKVKKMSVSKTQTVSMLRRTGLCLTFFLWKLRTTSTLSEREAHCEAFER